jgi:transposase
MKKRSMRHREAREQWNLLGFSYSISDLTKMTGIPRSTLSRWCASAPKGKQPIPGVDRDQQGRWVVRMGPELDQWITRYRREVIQTPPGGWMTSGELQRRTGASRPTVARWGRKLGAVRHDGVHWLFPATAALYSFIATKSKR